MASRVRPGPVPKEALAYLKDKDLRVGFDHRDVWLQEHAHAFTVAKMMQVDMLGDVHQSLIEALANGETFQSWQKRITPELQKRGWWGKKDQFDPISGEVREVQLGSPRRLKTIYRSNMRSARAAGQWERVQRNKEALPYLIYRLGPSENHRPEHVALDGLCLPVDHPFWKQWYPPNGWGCKCRVRAITRRTYERYLRDGIPDTQIGAARQVLDDNGRPTGRITRKTKPLITQAPDIDLREHINTRTGEATQVPVGIDPAWEHNPGQDRVRVLRERLLGKVDSQDQRMAQRSVEQLVGSQLFEGWSTDTDLDRRGEFPIGIVPRDVHSRLGASSQVVRFSPASWGKQLIKHHEYDLDTHRQLPELIRSGQPVLMPPKDNGTQELKIYARIEGRLWRAIVKRTSDNKLYMVTMHRSRTRDLQKDLKLGEPIDAAEAVFDL